MWRTFITRRILLYGIIGAICATYALSAVPGIRLLTMLATNSSTPLATIANSAPQALLSSPLRQPTSVVIPLVIASVLIGINIALLMAYSQLNAKIASISATGVAGTLAAFLGIGCAACGPLLVTSFLTSIGGVGSLVALPWGGEEIGYLGIFLLVLSVIFLFRALNKPLVC